MAVHRTLSVRVLAIVVVLIVALSPLLWTIRRHAPKMPVFSSRAEPEDPSSSHLEAATDTASERALDAEQLNVERDKPADKETRPPDKKEPSEDKVTGGNTKKSNETKAVLRTSRPTPAAADDPFCKALAPVGQKQVKGNITVHVVVVNRGVVRLFENLLCSLQRISKPPVRIAVLGMDKETCPYLERLSMFSASVCIPYVERMMEQLQEMEPLSYTQALEAGSLKRSEKFGSVSHKVLINAKLYATRDILACGFASFTTDADVVFFKDALVYFNNMIQGNTSLTMLYQKDQNKANYAVDANSGFYFVANTPDNLRFFHAVITNSTWWHIDQTRVNHWLASNKHNTPYSWSLLPIDAFPVGDQVIKHESKKKRYRYPYLVSGHANWSPNLGRKLHMLVTVGWWFTNFSSHVCLTADQDASFNITTYWPNCTDPMWDCHVSDR